MYLLTPGKFTGLVQLQSGNTIFYNNFHKNVKRVTIIENKNLITLDVKLKEVLELKTACTGTNTKTHQ